MEDKEVGELWISFVLGKGQQTRVHDQRYKDIAANLIRKLVEERADCAALDAVASQAKLRPQQHYIDLALRDFGIDPEDFTQAEG